MLTARMAMVPGDAPTADDPSRALEEQTASLRPAVRAAVACILGLARDHADVEDCTHEALRRAWEGRGRLHQGEALRPWLMGIARHVAIDHLRARQRMAHRMASPPAPGPDGSPVPPMVDAVVDPSPPADDQLSSARERARVRLAIESLSDGPRQALMLFHVEGLGYQEVSLRLGVPLGTVATWIARGRRSIAQALQEESRDP